LDKEYAASEYKPALGTPLSSNSGEKRLGQFDPDNAGFSSQLPFPDMEKSIENKKHQLLGASGLEVTKNLTYSSNASKNVNDRQHDPAFELLNRAKLVQADTLKSSMMSG